MQLPLKAQKVNILVTEAKLMPRPLFNRGRQDCLYTADSAVLTLACSESVTGNTIAE